MAVTRTVLPRKGLIQSQHGLTGYEADQDANSLLLDTNVIFLTDVLQLLTAGKGGFFGVTLINPTSTATVTAVLAGANVVLVQQFILPFTAKVSKVVFEINTAFAGGKCDLGIYDNGGNKLLNLGGQSTTATGIFSVTLGSPVTLAPGVYYLAWTGDNTTFVLRAFATNQAYEAYQRTNAARNGTAANAASAGILPATLGVITVGAFAAPAVWFEP